MTARSQYRHILVVLALTNLVSYAARNALFAVYPDLTARYGIDDAEIGFLQTVFMIPHAAGTLLFGWAGDRYDRRRVIVFGLVLASVAGAAGAIGASYHGLAASRALVGLGTAAVVPIANSILGQLYEGPHKASRMSIFNLGLFLGGVTGFGAGMALGFPLVVLALAVPGIVLGALIAGLAVPAHAAPPPGIAWWRYLAVFARRFTSDARDLLRIRTLRWVIISTTTMAFAAGGYNAWLKEFLVRDKGMSDAEATTLLVLGLSGGLSGILVGGRLADRMRARWAAGRLWTIVTGMVLTAPCAAIAIEIPAGVSLYVVSIATLFFNSWYHAPVAATVDDLAPEGRRVAAQGLVIFTMHMVGTAPSSWIVGEVSKRATLHDAMWVPTSFLVIAAAAMALATRSFEADHARSRPARWSGGSDPPVRSL